MAKAFETPEAFEATAFEIVEQGSAPTTNKPKVSSRGSGRGKGRRG